MWERSHSDTTGEIMKRWGPIARTLHRAHVHSPRWCCRRVSRIGWTQRLPMRRRDLPHPGA